MSFRETANPWGGNFASPVDKLLGTAFLQVRQVAENLDLINQISLNLAAVQAVAANLPGFTALIVPKVDVTPVTGFSQTVANTCTTLLLKPAGTLAAGTIIMPAAPVDGQIVHVCSSQTITALTVSPNSGQSISGAPTTISATTPFTMIYDLASTTWYRR